MSARSGGDFPRGSHVSPLVPAQAGTQLLILASRFRGNEREKCAFECQSAARILAARFASEVWDDAHPKREKGARDGGSSTDPRACASREARAGRCFSNEASSDCREPQVRQLSGVPRAMFEACSARPPVDFPFQAPSLAGLQSLSTAAGTCRRTAVGSRRSAGSRGPQRRAAGAPGPGSFGCRAGAVRPSPPTRPPPPVPAS